jgi:hypothetical protein
VAWIGDEDRVIAARTSPADADGPRILQGITAWVWVRLAEPTDVSDLAMRTDQAALIESAVEALAAADLLELE